MVEQEARMGINLFRLLLIVCAVCALLSGCTQSDEETLIPASTFLELLFVEYDVIDLGSLGGGETRPEALNNNTQIVGSSLKADGMRHAFLWEEGTMTDLFPDHTLRSKAFDINDQGNYVGAFYEKDGFFRWAVELKHAFTSIDGVLRENLHDKEDKGMAKRINEQNLVLGHLNERISSVTGGWEYIKKTVLWQLDEMTFVEHDIFGSGMNDAGHIVGHYGGTPLLVDDSGLTILPIGSAFNTAWINDINDSGVCVGASRFHDWECEWNPGCEPDLSSCKWNSQGVFEALAGGTRAFSINQQGDVVGEGELVTDMGEVGYYRALLWRDAKSIDLNALIPQDSGWRLIRATDINDKGEIIGLGVIDGEMRGYLLKKRLTIRAVLESGHSVHEWLIKIIGPPEVDFYVYLGIDDSLYADATKLSRIPEALRLGPVRTDADGVARVRLPQTAPFYRSALLVQVEAVATKQLSGTIRLLPGRN